MPLTQRALVVSTIGNQVTALDNRPVPEPGQKQVQVKVTVAGLNPHDQKSRDTGLFIANDLPSVLANDVVGTVTKLGLEVDDIAVGDRIVFQTDFKPGSYQNGLQEYAIADRLALAKLPDTVTDDEAATLPTNIIAPLVALFAEFGIPAPWAPAAKEFDYAGSTVLIVGGGTSCGRFGVQLAKLAGIGRIIVVGGNENQLKSFGATHFIDRHADDDTLLAKVCHVVGDDLLYAFDAANPPERQILALNALSNHKTGILARLLPLGPVDNSKVLGKKAGFEVKDVFGSSHTYSEVATGFWLRLPGFLQTGQIKPLMYTVKNGLSVENVNAVLDAYRDGLPITKTHIHL